MVDEKRGLIEKTLASFKKRLNEIKQKDLTTNENMLEAAKSISVLIFNYASFSIILTFLEADLEVRQTTA